MLRVIKFQADCSTFALQLLVTISAGLILAKAWSGLLNLVHGPGVDPHGFHAFVKMLLSLSDRHEVQLLGTVRLEWCFGECLLRKTHHIEPR
jgi:hypothetical protein